MSVGLGAGFWFVLTLAIEVTNRLADRVEDAINRPERTELCRQVGWRRLARLQTMLWGIVGASVAVWLAIEPGLLLAVVIALGVCAGIGYSRGPRLARHRLLVFVMLSGTFVGPFTLGWAAGISGAGAGDWHRLGQFVPLFWIGTLFITSLAGIKDLTDRDGDEAVGYRSVFLQFAERHSMTALAAVAAAPYAALVAFVGAGALPVRMLGLLGLLPISIAVGRAARAARGSAASELAVREALYLHWMTFTSAAVLVCYPGTALLASILAAWSVWALASRWAHWGDPLRPADVAAIAALALGSGGEGIGATRPATTQEREAWGTS